MDKIFNLSNLPAWGIVLCFCFYILINSLKKKRITIEDNNSDLQGIPGPQGVQGIQGIQGITSNNAVSHKDCNYKHEILDVHLAHLSQGIDDVKAGQERLFRRVDDLMDAMAMERVHRVGDKK